MQPIDMHVHTHAGLMAIFTDEPGLACSPWLSLSIQTIDDFQKIFIDEWKSQSLFYNTAKKSIIVIKFDVDNNTVVILYKKQQKSWHQSNVSLVHL